MAGDELAAVTRERARDRELLGDYKEALAKVGRDRDDARAAEMVARAALKVATEVLAGWTAPKAARSEKMEMRAEGWK